MKSGKIQKIIIVKGQSSLLNRRILELINEEKKVTNSKRSRCNCKSKSMEQLCDVFGKLNTSSDTADKNVQEAMEIERIEVKNQRWINYFEENKENISPNLTFY